MPMKWAEVITVRATGRNSQIIASTLKDLMRDMNRNTGHGRIRIYRRERIATDFCIVVHHHDAKQTSGASPLGVRLSAALKELGQVHHTVWITMDAEAGDDHPETMVP
jgi:hypothetical protein